MLNVTRFFSAASLLFSFTFIAQAQAQNDAQAQAILNRVSRVYQTYSTITSTFSLTTKNSNGGTTVSTGKIWMKGKMYKLDYADQQIYCNGTYIWTYNELDAEVTQENFVYRSNNITPNEIFTIYNRDFRSTYDGPLVRNGKNYDVVLMLPKKATNYSWVKIEVDKSTNKVQRLIQRFKNGTEVTIEVTSFVTNQTLSDAFFKWNQAAHSDVDLVDLTH
ncbi:MAG: LolA family protein [Bacteroidia bacterium]